MVRSPVRPPETGDLLMRIPFLKRETPVTETGTENSIWPQVAEFWAENSGINIFTSAPVGERVGGEPVYPAELAADRGDAVGVRVDRAGRRI